MKYVAFIGTSGVPAPEALGVMQRDLPGWIAEMDGRGVRLAGRELTLPDQAVTVRLRDGETLVTDGPFAETKEFVAGFDLLDCADLDEAIEVMGSSPVARFHPIEIRPFRQLPKLGDGFAAFAGENDSAGTPYLLTAWGAEPPVDSPDYDAWQRDLEARNLHVLGGALAGTDTATTVRVRDGEAVLSDGSFLGSEPVMDRIDVVRCADRAQAIELAAGHPMARSDTVEVRPFYSE